MALLGSDQGCGESVRVDVSLSQAQQKTYRGNVPMPLERLRAIVVRKYQEIKRV
jgi:hypothetical protein